LRIKRCKAVLLSVLVIVSLLMPMLTLMNTAEAQVPSEIVVTGKNTAYNVNNRAPTPWKTYDRGSIPPLMVAKRVGSGAVIAAGFAPACRDGHWNIPENPDNHLPELLDASFQWMVPGATTVLWYEGYNVFNNRGACGTLVEAVTNLGYSISGDTSPFTATLLGQYDIVVIAQMQLPYPPSTGKPSGDPDLLPDADVQAIKTWVEGGGGLLIMEATDFFDYKYPEVSNKVLMALGFDYLFQDDSVYDDTNNIADATYRAIVDVDPTTEIGAAYQSLTGKTTVGMYGYCSLAQAGPGVSVKVVSDYQVGMPGTTLEYDVVVFNPYNPDAVDLTYDILVMENADWSPSVSPNSLSVPVGENRTATLTVTVPAGTPLCTEDEITVLVTASGYTGVTDSFTCHAHAGLSIKPTMDAYASDAENDKPYGSDDPLPLYTGRYGANWQNTYLQFDLPYTIPSDASITDARLFLFCYNVYGTQVPIACWEVDDDEWDELTITWRNKPESGAILDQQLARIGEREFPISYSWDVTSFVDQEFDGDKIVSLCLGGLEDTPISVNESFESKDWPYEDRVQPFLRVAYTTEVVPRKVSVSISPTTRSGSPGDDVTFTVTVTNEGSLDDSYSLTVTDTAGWSPSISPSTLTLDAEDSGTATVTVTIPDGAAEGDSTTITVTASGAHDSDSNTCTARAKMGGGLPIILIAIVVVVVVVVIVVALVLMRGRGAAPTWTG